MDVVEHQDNHEQVQVSPLVVGILGILAGVMLVASFHCMMLCLRNGSQATSSPRRTTTLPSSQRQAQQPQSSSNSRSRAGPIMATSTYAMSDNKEREEDIVEVCAVCLGEFREGEVIRILPQCGHMYHVPCIDKWLDSHSNCPLCRTNTTTASSNRCLPEQTPVGSLLGTALV